jgi:hypothetical protein
MRKRVRVKERFTTQISDIRLPLLIPRRGKGAFETLAKCGVSTPCKIDPLTFIPSFIPYAKQTFTQESMLTLVQEIQNTKKLSHVEVTVAFSYALERSSPTFQEVYFELPCVYSLLGKGSTHTLRMAISIPIRVYDIYPVLGTLQFEIQSPTKHIFFEDMIDHVQKFAGVVLYPLAESSDRPPLKNMLDVGKSPTEFLAILQDSSKHKHLGEGGFAHVFAKDVYSMYGLNYRVEW